MKKIIFSTRERIWGGGEVILTDLIASFKEIGYQVYLKSPQDALIRKMNPNTAQLNFVSFVASDAVIANDFRSVWVSLLTDGITQRLFIVHGEWQLSVFRSFILKFFRVKVFSVNSSLTSKLQEYGIRSAVTLPIGPKTASRLEDFQIQKQNFRDLIFGNVSRLDPIKRLPLFADTLEKLDLKGIIVCPPPSNSKESGLLDELSSFSNITVHADGNPQWVWDSADFFLSTSKSESLGIAILEALSRGLPVITTANGGPQELLTNLLSRGLIIGPTEEIAEKLPTIVSEIRNNLSSYFEEANSLLDSRGPNQTAKILRRALHW